MFDLTEYAEAVNNGLADRTPTILATMGDDGVINLGVKGSMMVFDKDRLAYWERTRGQHLANLRKHPQVTVLYINLERRGYVRFQGDAQIHEKGDPLWDQIMSRVVPPELERDPERLGYSVSINVHTVTDLFKRQTFKRDQ